MSGTFSAAEKVPDTFLLVTTPPNRLDIQAGAADLIEEIARIYGYDRVPATLLADPLPPQTGNADLELRGARPRPARGPGLAGSHYLFADDAGAGGALEPTGGRLRNDRQPDLDGEVRDAAHASGRRAGGGRVQPQARRHGQGVRGRQCLPATRGSETARRAAAVGDRADRQAVTAELAGRHNAGRRPGLLRPQGRGRIAGRRSAFAERHVSAVVVVAPAPWPLGRPVDWRQIGRQFRRTAPEGSEVVRRVWPSGAGRRVRLGGDAGGDSGPFCLQHRCHDSRPHCETWPWCCRRK